MTCARWLGYLAGFGVMVVMLGAASFPTLAAAADPTCPASGATVTQVYRSGDPTAKDTSAEIGNKVVVVLDKPAAFLAEAACLKKSVLLYLDGQITGNKLAVPVNPDGGLVFFLRPVGGSREFWTAQFGRPDFDARPLRVTVGIEDQPPLPSDKTLNLIVLPPGWLALWLAFFALLIVGFFKLARNSWILRDALLDPDAPIDTLGAYSLSKMQGAWWFFIIVACYLLIGIVTGDYSNSINSTALILLGIGAGTVLGSAAIDASKLNDRKADLQTAKTALTQARAGNDPAAVAKVQARVDALNGKSEGFLKDILSDGNGINFHRFQLAAWTAVLSIVFIADVYGQLAMPTFNTTLMGLVGLSAGTYLGLKIPEPTQPTQ